VDIVKQRTQLPTTTDELHKYIIIGKERLKARQAEIRAYDKIDYAENAKAAVKENAQNEADTLLDAESKLGELLAVIPPKRHGLGSKGGTSPTLPKTITKKESHYAQTISSNPEIVEQVKAKAREEGTLPTTAEVVKAVKKKTLKKKNEAYLERVEEKKSISVDIFNTDKKYRILYADPPWNYNDKQNTPVLGGAAKHYSTMTIDELCALPIKDITEKDAVLFLWVTSPILKESFKVISSWDMKYKASFIWDKVGHNMGHYNSVRHEFLLICTKGSCTPDNKKLFDSVQSIEKQRNHSEKPIEFMNIIDEIYTFGDRIELFARSKKKESWDVWGNEI